MAATSHGIQVVERERVAAPPADRPAAPTASEAPPATPAMAVEDGGGTVPVGGLALLGVLTLLIGAWGGIVPFIGPLIGANADGTMSWYWSLPHALLWVAPGGAACVAAALMLGAMPRAMVGFGRAATAGAGLLAMVCGAWFVIGPEAWPVLFHSAGVFVPTGPLMTLAHEVGYSFGPGVLLLVFGAMAVGMAGRVSRFGRVTGDERVVRRAPVPARAVSGRPVTA